MKLSYRLAAVAAAAVIFSGAATVLADTGRDIFTAARLGDVPQLTSLLNADPTLLDARTAAGETPLHYAAMGRSVAAADLLLQCGADVAAVDNAGRTALHVAATSNNADLIARLLEAGANVTATDDGGETPLHLAARRFQPGATAALLAAGANPNARNVDGQAPLHVLGSAARDADGVQQVIDGLALTLIAAGADPALLDNAGVGAWPHPAQEGATPREPSGYPSYDSIVATLLAKETAYPSLCKRYDLGVSSSTQHLYALKISDNVNVEEDEPEFKWVSTMHGDEVTGVVMSLNMIDYLLTNYGTLPRVTDIVNNMEIWIVPCMNPYGYTNNVRNNANGSSIDLNRSFPEGSGPSPDPNPNPSTGLQPEVNTIINWTFAHSFTLAGNFHGGALVANYPFDNDNMGSVYSPTPDDDLFIYISEQYSYYNSPMWNSGSFTHGITNGADWYAIDGGMQDWDYRYMGCNEVTFEISTTKAPPYSQMTTFWSQNRDSMLAYMETSLIGVRGIVTGSTGLPIAATVTVAGRNHNVYTDPDVGDYHRMLMPGTYSLTFSATGYTPLTYNNVVVSSGAATRLDVTFPPAAATLSVTPADGLASSGGTGGPFSPSSKIYTLTNQGTASINYTVAKTQSWVTLSGTGGTLAGGANTNITVSINTNANSLAAGTYNDTVTFTNTTNGLGNTTRPVSLQITAPSLVVTPAGGLSSSGIVGGPFSPSSIDYTLQNPGASSINYTVAKTQTWVTLSSTGGTLTGGGSTTVTVSINSNANSLAVGSYSDTVTFTNTTNGLGNTTRAVSLQVNPISNDACANAYVACPGTYTGTTVGMTLDSGVSVSCDGTSPGVDVWYKYTPATGGSATFSLCTSGTVWDSVISVHTGSCPGTTQVGCNDDGCSGSGGRHGTLTATLTSGTTYLIRIGGYSSSYSGPFTLTISGPACQSSDTTPPDPTPMTFAVAPAPASTASISMTATTATDPTPPINYNFNCVTDSTDSGWQTSTAYTDSGLTANTAYTYRVKARDGASPTPNETAYSSNSATATYIETPTGVSFGTLTTTTIDLNATGTLTNLTTGSSGAYFDSTTTGGDGGINAWVQVATDQATGLTANTAYTFQAKARNQNSIETAYGPTNAAATLIQTPTGVSFGTVTNNSIVINAAGTLTNLALPSSGVYFDSTTAGGDGDINAWVTTPTDTATGLLPDTSYIFQVKARNQNSVETAYSPTAAKATLANIPAAPTLANPTTSTMTLDVNANGNPTWTVFAIQCTATSPNDAAWLNKYVNAAGASSASAVWQTELVWANITVSSLQPATTYTFAVKARNQESIETAFGPGMNLATLPLPTGACCYGDAPCAITTQAACGGTYQGNNTTCTPYLCCPTVMGDLDGNGVVDGADIQGFVDAMLAGFAPCADLAAPYGVLDMADVSAFVNLLLGP